MSHIDILRCFNSVMLRLGAGGSDTMKMVNWFPNGKDSIRIRTALDFEFVFTYVSDEEWIIEPASSFVKRLRGEKNELKNI